MTGCGARAVALAGAVALMVLPARADGAWYGELRTEPSSVHIHGHGVTWWTSRAQLGFRDDPRGAAFGAVEVQRRGELTDSSLQAGGHRRLGDWTVGGQASVGLDAVFVPELAVEAQLSRRMVGGFVAQLGYRHLRFVPTDVDLVSPAAFYYFASGWVEARFDAGRNHAFDHDIRVGLLRARWDRSGKWAAGVGLAVGQYLYDALGVIGGDGGDGWTAFVHGELRLSPRDALRLDLSAGEEGPAFRQRSVGLSYRRGF